MANKRRKNSYQNDGFDMKSLGALLVIIIGVAVIILLVKSTENKNTAIDSNNNKPGSSVNTDVSDWDDNDVDSDSTTDDDNDNGTTEETTTTTEAAFTVTVSGLDGTYNRTNVESSNGASLKISDQDKSGFDFTLKLPGEKYSGYAQFVGETTAEWEGADGTLKFECGKGKVVLSGIKAANGKYIDGEPTYTDEEESDYDAGIINASSTRSKFADIMSSDDYALLKKLLNEGSSMGISQSSSEYQTDKNGNGIMVDKETGMIKYQYELQYEGKCMVLCSVDGGVCVGIYNENDDTGELRYYASTSALRKNIPGCIENYAVAYGFELVKG